MKQADAPVGVDGRACFDVAADHIPFIRLRAARHMKAGVSKTMVHPADEKMENGKYPICAYYTMAPSSISVNELLKKQAGKLPHYPVPVYLLARMAVNSECQGKGLGKITRIKVLEYMSGICESMPAWAVIVDCLNSGTSSFYSKYGFKYLFDYNGKERIFLPMKTVLSLFGSKQ
ncbi:MAG: hypothetical protein AVO35_12440 [Candidatus Aegiribacteria sp. MLS_C]|nr:MAG: hypothetical protein AVO35_12440 [Candidatus Aegiribacteria sp. MLS_C]